MARFPRLYARVLDVDNARETVRNNEILGIIQPHASKKASLIFAGLSATNPFSGYAIKGVQTVYGVSIRREIFFPASTDLQIQIVRPSMLKQEEPWPGWSQLAMDPDLQDIVRTAPLRTTATNKISSDLTNLIFIGSKQRLASSFTESHWIESDDMGVKAALKVAQATVRNTGYNSAPMSTQLLNGQAPDLTFQKSLNTFAKRPSHSHLEAEKDLQGAGRLDRGRHTRHCHREQPRLHQVDPSHRSAARMLRRKPPMPPATTS